MSDLVNRLRQFGGREWETTECYNGLRVEAAARIEALERALRELVDAVVPEVNEKGAGGYLLARLSDARAALSGTTPPADGLVEALSKGGVSLIDDNVWLEFEHASEAEAAATAIRAALTAHRGDKGESGNG